MKTNLVSVFVLVLILIMSGCAGGGSSPLIVDHIMGSAYVYEGEVEEYSVQATGDTGITYLWAIEPSSIGTFTGQGSSTIYFTAAEVEEDTPGAILVTVSSDSGGSEFRRLNMVVRDGTSSGFIVSEIHGPSTVFESSDVDYSVEVTGDTGITFQWEVTPFELGSLTGANTSHVTLTGGPVAGELTGVIRVTVNSDNNGPIVKTKDITVTNSDFGWAQSWGGWYCDAMDVASLSDGSVVVVGKYGKYADLDPTSAEDNRTAISNNTYVSKYTPTGDYLWGIDLGPTGYAEPERMVVDSDDNFYIAGVFTQTCDFDPGPEVYELTTGAMESSYVLSLDKDGNFRWAVPVGMNQRIIIDDLAVSHTGRIVTTGHFNLDADFDPSPDNQYVMVANGEADIFVLSLDPDGVFEWAVQAGSTGFNHGYTVNTDSYGNIYAGGDFEGIVDFDPSPGVLDKALRESEGDQDAFVLSLTPHGDYRWVQTWGGASGADTVTAIAISNSDDILTAGSFAGPADLDPDPLVTNEFSSSGSNDAYMSMFDTLGEYQWTVTWGGTIGESIFDACFDHDNIIAGGIFFGNDVDFDPGPSVATADYMGEYDCYVSKFDSDGTFQWVNTFGSTEIDALSGVVAGPSSAVYVAGSFSEEIDLQPGPEEDIHPLIGDNFSAFLVKYLQDGSW